MINMVITIIIEPHVKYFLRPFIFNLSVSYFLHKK